MLLPATGLRNVLGTQAESMQVGWRGTKTFPKGSFGDIWVFVNVSSSLVAREINLKSRGRRMESLYLKGGCLNLVGMIHTWEHRDDSDSVVKGSTVQVGSICSPHCSSRCRGGTHSHMAG